MKKIKIKSDVWMYLIYLLLFIMAVVVGSLMGKTKTVQAGGLLQSTQVPGCPDGEPDENQALDVGWAEACQVCLDTDGESTLETVEPIVFTEFCETPPCPTMENFDYGNPIIPTAGAPGFEPGIQDIVIDGVESDLMYVVASQPEYYLIPNEGTCSVSISGNSNRDFWGPEAITSSLWCKGQIYAGTGWSDRWAGSTSVYGAFAKTFELPLTYPETEQGRFRFYCWFSNPAVEQYSNLNIETGSCTGVNAYDGPEPEITATPISPDFDCTDYEYESGTAVDLSMEIEYSDGGCFPIVPDLSVTIPSIPLFLPEGFTLATQPIEACITYVDLPDISIFGITVPFDIIVSLALAVWYFSKLIGR